MSDPWPCKHAIPHDGPCEPAHRPTPTAPPPSEPRLDPMFADLIEKANDIRYSDEFIGDLFRATFSALGPEWHDRLRSTPPAASLDVLVDAISTLENYGDHHEWCAQRQPRDRPAVCDCGFVVKMIVLREQYTRLTDRSPTDD